MKWTSLHVAIYKGHRDIAILLLERGANMEVLCSLDQTALYNGIVSWAHRRRVVANRSWRRFERDLRRLL